MSCNISGLVAGPPKRQRIHGGAMTCNISGPVVEPLKPSSESMAEPCPAILIDLWRSYPSVETNPWRSYPSVEQIHGGAVPCKAYYIKVRIASRKQDGTQLEFHYNLNDKFDRCIH
jgi:hypothetical protein